MDESSLDEAALMETAQVETFLNSIASGVPELLAGVELGWSPRQTKARLADPEFAQLVGIYKDLANDGIERALYKLANSGHLGAIQMWLYNKRAEQWRDVRRIEVRNEHTINVDAVAAARDAVLAALTSGNIGALQPGGALDAIETTGSE